MFSAGKIALIALKCVTLCYWAWVVRSALVGEPSAFDKLLAATAPAVIGLHFLQLMMFMRAFKRRSDFSSQVAQTLLFGAFHIGSMVLSSRQAAARSKATS